MKKASATKMTSRSRRGIIETGRAWPRRLGQSLLILALAIALLIAGAMLWDMAASARTAADYPPRGEFVDVGGARMHVICQGAGEPTLVLQAGIAGGALDWLSLMDELATANRVCAFDRLGQDWSDPAPAPRTFATAANEWHAAIQALGIERPVAVGHSLGGAVAQLYAARYPVSGVILVDGLTADAAAAVTRRLANYQALNGLGRAGLLRPMAALFADRAYADDLRREMMALRARSDSLLNVTAEGALAAESLPAELAATAAQLDAPLLIIAAGASGLPEAEVFLASMRTLAESQPDAQFVFVPDAAHYVIASHATLVADTIADWLSDQLNCGDHPSGSCLATCCD